MGVWPLALFKVGLPLDSKLMKFLTMNPVEYMHQLMGWIEEYKRVEDNQVQGKGKAKAFAQDRKDLRPNHFKPPRPRREFFNQTP